MAGLLNACFSFSWIILLIFRRFDSVIIFFIVPVFTVGIYILADIFMINKKILEVVNQLKIYLNLIISSFLFAGFLEFLCFGICINILLGRLFKYMKKILNIIMALTIVLTACQKETIPSKAIALKDLLQLALLNF